MRNGMKAMLKLAGSIIVGLIAVRAGMGAAAR